jgi:hypothetical protein
MFIYIGVVYCGTVGNEVRREYAAIGDVVNLAARLMSNAQGGYTLYVYAFTYVYLYHHYYHKHHHHYHHHQGEILIDEATHMRLPSDVLKKMKKLNPMKIKGTDKEINPYVFDTSYISTLDGLAGDTENTLYEFIPIRQICRDAFYPLIHLISGTVTPVYTDICDTFFVLLYHLLSSLISFFTYAFLAGKCIENKFCKYLVVICLSKHHHHIRTGGFDYRFRGHYETFDLGGMHVFMYLFIYLYMNVCIYVCLYLNKFVCMHM